MAFFNFDGPNFIVEVECCSSFISQIVVRLQCSENWTWVVVSEFGLFEEDLQDVVYIYSSLGDGLRQLEPVLAIIDKLDFVLGTVVKREIV